MIKNIINKIKKKKKFFIIIDDKEYFDSSKAKFIIRYFRGFRGEKEFELYLTNSGKWIEIEERDRVIFLEEKDVKKLLNDLNAVKLYEKYINKLELI